MRKTIIITLMLFLLISLNLTVSANPNDWKDQNYDFNKIKTVLIMEPKMTYDDYANGCDKFEKYPNGKEKIKDYIASKFKSNEKIRYVDINYVIKRIKADPSYSPDCNYAAPEFWQIVRKELPKYVDAVLLPEIRNFGWYYEYHDAYITTDTVIDKVQYGGVTPDGKPFTGWMEVPRTVVVHHDAGYNIYDSAEVHLGIVDANTWKYIWKYTDVRTRSSFSFANSYDHTGPESMMNRIFDKLTEKHPFTPEKKQQREPFSRSDEGLYN